MLDVRPQNGLRNHGRIRGRAGIHVSYRLNYNPAGQAGGKRKNKGITHYDTRYWPPDGRVANTYDSIVIFTGCSINLGSLPAVRIIRLKRPGLASPGSVNLIALSVWSTIVVFVSVLPSVM